ncbi:C-terminal domain of CHU protein family protein, partial [Flavobacterium fluvii]
SNCQAIVPDFTKNVTATDTCTSSDLLIVTQSPAAGTVALSGTTTIVITVKDACGNESTCESKLIVTNFIVANDDTGTPVNGYTGGVSFTNVLSNDLLNCKTVNTENVNITFVSSTNSNISLSGTNVIVAPGTPVGNYSLVYQICEKLNPANCDAATVTVNVTAPLIDAVPDNAGPIVGVNQTIVNVINVLTNDTLNGSAVIPSQVILTTNNSNPFLHINPDGSVDVLPNAPAGPQTVTYQICEVLNPENCDSATVTINIETPVMKITATPTCINDVPYIVYTATPDNFTPVNGLTITWTDSKNNVVSTMTNLPLSGQVLWPGATIDQNGNGTDWPGWVFTNNKWIQAADGFENLRPKATLAFTLNPTETIVVDYPPSSPFCTSRPTFVIDAVNDNAGTNNGANGVPNIVNVFTNDLLNNAAVNPADVFLTTVIPNNNLILNSNGAVDVVAGTPAGTYTLTYQICEKADNGNCDQAVVTITVALSRMASSAPVINRTVNCDATSLAINLLENVTMNEIPVTLNMVNISLTSGSNPKITLSNLGSLNAENGIPVGLYQFAFEVCDKLNPGNCAAGIVNITVQDITAPVIAQLPAPKTISCGAPIDFAQAVATDSCGSATLTFVDTKTNGACAGSYSITRTWTATDASGNITKASQTINVTDTVAPVIAALPATSTISCPATPVFAVATATDACGSAFTLTSADVTTKGLCAGSYSITRTWTATDACGNISKASQTINVQDLVGPTTNTVFPASVNVTCDAIPAKPDLVFVDNCSTVATPVYTENIINQTLTSYSILREWNVADACGNASKFVQTVNVTIANGGTTYTSDACNADSTPINLNDLLPTGTPTNGTWINKDNIGILQGSSFNPLDAPLGIHVFEYNVIDGSCPTRITLNLNINFDCKVLGCEAVVVHNAFTPNGDGINEKLVVDGVNDDICYPSGIGIEIYNRWGVLVFETTKYDNETNAFEGYS